MRVNLKNTPRYGSICYDILKYASTYRSICVIIGLVTLSQFFRPSDGYVAIVKYIYKHKSQLNAGSYLSPTGQGVALSTHKGLVP